MFAWENIPLAHQMMWKNQHKPGNMAVLVNAPRAGLRNFEDVLEAAGGGVSGEGQIAVAALGRRPA